MKSSQIFDLIIADIITLAKFIIAPILLFSLSISIFAFSTLLAYAVMGQAATGKFYFFAFINLANFNIPTAILDVVVAFNWVVLFGFIMGTVIFAAKQYAKGIVERLNSRTMQKARNNIHHIDFPPSEGNSSEIKSAGNS